MQSTYDIGTVIQCSAEGKPAPVLEWTDLISGNVIQGSALVIRKYMINKTHTFQCTASNQYNGVNYRKTKRITFRVQVEGTRKYMTFYR